MRFSFGSKSSESPLAAPVSAAPSSEPISTGPGAVAAHTVAEARQSAERLASVSTRKRRPAQTGAGDSADTERALQDKVNQELIRQLDALHSPKAWGALLAAPGDAMLVVSGREHWEISKDERETLGECGSAAARTLMITNPRALGLLMLSASIFSVYMPRALKTLEDMRKEKAEAARQPKGETPK